MNKKIFAVTCDLFNLGTAFLIWSIHYCTNQKDFYHTKKEEFITIPEDPFEGFTAHKMSPNSSLSDKDLEAVIEKSLEKLNHLRNWPMLDQATGECTNKAFLNKMETYGIKCVNITCKKLQCLIGVLRFNYTEPNWQYNLDAIKKHCEHYWPHFFDNPDIFPNKLNTWHDIREGIALYIRPYDFLAEKDTGTNTYDCQFENLLLDGKNEIMKILKFLNYTADSEALDNWCSVHRKWRDILEHYIHFCNDVELIIDSIINNKFVDLQKYKMDVLKEGVLLHLLMFKHNLNLIKPIEKFPHNTQEISKLLGKNLRTGIVKVYE